MRERWGERDGERNGEWDGENEDRVGLRGLLVQRDRRLERRKRDGQREQGVYIEQERI